MTDQQPVNILFIVGYIAIIGLAMYFFLIRPQRKQKKKEEAMRNNIQMGDEIITIGGIHGRIVTIKDDCFVIESPVDHTKIKIAKWAIQTNLTVHE